MLISSGEVETGFIGPECADSHWVLTPFAGGDGTHLAARETRQPLSGTSLAAEDGRQGRASHTRTPSISRSTCSGDTSTTLKPATLSPGEITVSLTTASVCRPTRRQRFSVVTPCAGFAWSANVTRLGAEGLRADLDPGTASAGRCRPVQHGATRGVTRVLCEDTSPAVCRRILDALITA